MAIERYLRQIIHSRRFLSWAAGVFIVLAAVLIPPSRHWLTAQAKVLTGSGGPQMTIITETDAVSELREKIAELTAQLEGLSKERSADVEAMQKLQADYQKAIHEVASAHDSFAQEAEQVRTFLNKSGVAVAVQSSSLPGAPTASVTPPASDKIHLNTATASQLDELPGIGPAYAQRIIDYRNEHGPFKSVDDLDAISGIGAATIEKIRNLVEL